MSEKDPDWTIPKVEEEPDADGYYRTLEECDDTCGHMIHAFHSGRRKHLIDGELVAIARKHGWFH